MSRVQDAQKRLMDRSPGRKCASCIFDTAAGRYRCPISRDTCASCTSSLAVVSRAQDDIQEVLVSREDRESVATAQKRPLRCIRATMQYSTARNWINAANDSARLFSVFR